MEAIVRAGANRALRKRPPSGSMSSLLNKDELSRIAGFVNEFRSNVGLDPISGVDSNFIHENKGQEIAHILGMEFDAISKELESAGEGTAQSVERLVLGSGSGRLALRG